jgi:hypothetical protein
MSNFDLNIGVLNELPPKKSHELGTTNIVDYTEFDKVTGTSSNEAIGAGMEAMSPQQEYRARMVDRFFEDCGEAVACGRPAPHQLIWTKKISDDKKSTCWTFYLNQMFLSFRIINDFVNKMLLPKAGDCVHIYLPAEVYIDDAEVLASAIANCATQKICMTAPYILNSGAAYLMCFAKHINISPACVAHIDMAMVGGGGKLADAVHSIECGKIRATKILFKLKECGFVTDADLDHIVNNQGEIVLFGDKYAQILRSLNSKYESLWK